MTNPFKTFGISLARAAAFAVAHRYSTDMNWRLRFASNAIYTDFYYARTAEAPIAAHRMALAGRHADIIIKFKS